MSDVLINEQKLTFSVASTSEYFNGVIKYLGAFCLRFNVDPYKGNYNDITSLTKLVNYLPINIKWQLDTYEEVSKFFNIMPNMSTVQDFDKVSEIAKISLIKILCELGLTNSNGRAIEGLTNDFIISKLQELFYFKVNSNGDLQFFDVKVVLVSNIATALSAFTLFNI